MTQVAEVASSTRMEKAGLIKTLQELNGNDHKIKRLTTNRQLQIKKYMCKQKEHINHQFDARHFSKSIKTKLLNASNTKTCEELKP